MNHGRPPTSTPNPVGLALFGLSTDSGQKIKPA
jgi:hypothetical protein